MGKKLNERGSFSYFFIFVIAAIILVFFFALIVPLMVTWNTTLYEASEGMLEDSLAVAGDINDPGVSAAFTSSITAASDSLEDQVDILSVFFRYSWLIIIFIAALVIFLFARMQVESGGVS